MKIQELINQFEHFMSSYHVLKGLHPADVKTLKDALKIVKGYQKLLVNDKDWR